MDDSEMRIRIAERKARELGRFCESQMTDDRSLSEIDIPKQTIWLFHQDVAIRAIEILKLVGLRCRLKRRDMR